MTDSLPEKQHFKLFSAKSAGFTLIELLIAIAIIAILSAVSFPIYKNFIDKANVTVSISTLEAVRKAMEDYYISNEHYPPAIDTTTGEDGQGRVILGPSLLADFNRSLFSMESYVATATFYTLTARAKDTNHTLLVLSPRQVINQGP